MDSSETKKAFFELLNTYPSPHNGQPMRIKELEGGEFELFFDKSRGLQSTDISFLFSFVSMGVFVEYIDLCGKALGHTVSAELNLPSQESLQGEGLAKFATLHVAWHAQQPDESVLAALNFRQTSRKKYYDGVPDAIADLVVATAAKQSMSLTKLPQHLARQAIWLNQRAVFDDVQDEPVRRELDYWLRYTQAEKTTKMDGLAYDCMELNGRTMRYIIAHPRILKNKIISTILKKYYLRTMTDNSDVFYMLAPFDTEENSFAVGKMVMQLWQLMSMNGLYVHPFGTIMSNHRAHQDFIKLADVQSESRQASYLVFIFRAGKSEQPVPSLRIPYNQHLIIQE